jgi:glycosyltransferase involved in cell wall biosynthesis
MSLSVVINTFNEEKNIRDCLETVRWADEIIVVDMYSDDRTVEIAREYTDKIFFHERTYYVEPARNFAISQASCDWFLILDADERIPPELRDEIIETIQNPGDYVAFRILRRDYMFGRWINYGIWRHQQMARLFRKGSCHWPDRVHTQPIVNGPIGMLKTPFPHFSHRTIERFIAKLNLYTSLEAQEKYKQGIRTSLFVSFLSACIRFAKEYVAYQGFRDGGHGLILAILMAVYQFTTNAKLWELWYKHDHNLPLD